MFRLIKIASLPAITAFLFYYLSRYGAHTLLTRCLHAAYTLYTCSRVGSVASCPQAAATAAAAAEAVVAVAVAAVAAGAGSIPREINKPGTWSGCRAGAY